MALSGLSSKATNQRYEVVKKAIFFDRDGVLNHLVNHDGQMTAPWHIDEFRFIEGAADAVELANDMGYLSLVVTNQPDVYDGKLSIHHLKMMMKMCIQWLNAADALVAFERGSAWYKPNNGMLETLIRGYNIDRGQSYIIGDRWKDIVAGHKSKLTTIYVGPEPYSSPEKYQHIYPDHIASNVLEACFLIAEMNPDD